MAIDHAPLSSEAIQMLVSSVTQQGNAPLQEIAAERLLNAITRAQSGVPTAVSTSSEPNQNAK